MNWDELKEKAKEIGNTVVEDGEYNHIIVPTPKSKRYRDIRSLSFYRNGTVSAGVCFDDCVCSCIIAYDRTPDQMWQIMEALQ